jgi:hypothetical protein
LLWVNLKLPHKKRLFRFEAAFFVFGAFRLAARRRVFGCTRCLPQPLTRARVQQINTPFNKISAKKSVKNYNPTSPECLKPIGHAGSYKRLHQKNCTDNRSQK